MKSMTALQPLIARLLEIQHVNSAAALAGWDQETYMPSGAGLARAEQLAALHGLAHDKLVAPETEELLVSWLDPATGMVLDPPDEPWDEAARALLRETWRDFRLASKLPSDFVRTLRMPFWRCYYPLLQQTFPEQLGGVSLEQFYAAINRVKPSLIRVEADELTYNLHIMLRFEIELDLIEGRSHAKDLPALWGERMASYLGIVPERDAEGVLQDVHWSLGAFGYFPTYTLGNLYAVQLYEQARRDLPALEHEIEAGRLTILTDWLREKIHRWGRLVPATELVRRVTGGSLSPEPFLRYLEDKFGALYQVAAR